MLYHVYICINFLKISIISCSETFTQVRGQSIKKKYLWYFFIFLTIKKKIIKVKKQTKLLKNFFFLLKLDQWELTTYRVIPSSNFFFEYHRTVNPKSRIHSSSFYLKGLQV